MWELFNGARRLKGVLPIEAMTFKVFCVETNRRNFCKSAAVAVIGGVAAAVPIGAGLTSFVQPLREGGAKEGQWIPVTALEALPAGDAPMKFLVVANKVDAWSKTPNVPVGAVYLIRNAKGDITALNVICPHAGGIIDYDAAEGCFLCPLHKSLFNADGSLKNAKSPSPRPMDTLQTEVRDGTVWVRFENFRVGVRQKIPA